MKPEIPEDMLEGGTHPKAAPAKSIGRFDWIYQYWPDATSSMKIVNLLFYSYGG